jgi:hypothetical protein
VAEFLLDTEAASRVGLAEICRSPHAVRKYLDYSASAKGFIQFGTSRAYFLPNSRACLAVQPNSAETTGFYIINTIIGAGRPEAAAPSDRRLPCGNSPLWRQALQ